MAKNKIYTILLFFLTFGLLYFSAHRAMAVDWSDILSTGEKCSGLPRDLILSVIWVESGGNPNAVNINGVRGFQPSSAENAMTIMRHYNNSNVDIGLMQINWKTWGKVLKLKPAEMLDPRVNVCYGAAILKSYITEHKGSWKGVGRYNAVSYNKQVLYASKVYKTLLRIKKIAKTGDS